MIKNKRTVKLVSGVVGLAMAFSFALPVSAATAADIQAQINSLMATIQSLQAQLSATGGSSSTSVSTGYTFNTNLTIGSTGVDVMNLQKVLNMSADTQVASTGTGSAGKESTYFGTLTKNAVIKFQNKYGISPAAGYVGPITRAKLNSMNTTTTTTTGNLPAGCTSTSGYSSTTGQPCSGTTTTTMPTGGALTVMSGAQPANSLAPQGASLVPFTTITLTAGASDVTVNSVTVQRSGLGQDAVFAGVVLLDSNGMQVGIAKTLNSNHQAMIGEPMVIPAGTTKTFRVAGNMASTLTSYAGQVVGLDVVAVNTTATVAGSLPITGAQQTINATLTIGNAQVAASSYDPLSHSSQPIGTTGYRFSGVRITAGSAEDVTVKSIRWNQTGSAGSTDLANIVTIVNGTSYPTTISTDGKYYTSVFPGGIIVPKGNSVDVYVQGDIVGSGAANRTVEFDVYKTTDVYMTGNTYGYGVSFTATSFGSAAPDTGANTTSTPFFHGSTVTITAGSVTLIGKATEVAAQNIATNVPNQVLGGFATNFTGEPVSVQSLYFSISTTSGSLPTTANSPYSAITSVSLVDENGAVVAGPVDASLADGSTAHGGTTSAATSYAWVHFTDTVTFPVGRHVYTLKGKLPSTWANGAVVAMWTNPATDWTNVTGQTTGNTISLSTATTFSMNQMTVKGAALAVNVSAQPTSQTLVAGVQNVVLANYTLDASQSGEDVRMSSFPIKITDSSISDLTGCQLYNGATPLNTGSRVVNGSSLSSGTAYSVSLDNSLTVPKGTVVTLSLHCNISSGATASITMGALASGNFTVTGQTSGNSVTVTTSGASGAVFALSSGSLAMSIDASSPSYAVVNGGATGQTVAVIKLRASNEAMNLSKIGLNLNSGTASDVVTAYLYANGSQIGSMQFVSGSTSATSTLATSLSLPKDTDVLVTVKADLASVGTGQSGTPGTLIKVDPLNAEATGQSSGTTIGTSASQSSHVAGVRVFKSYPTVVLDTLSSNGIADGRFMRFKVTATNSGPVGLDQFVFTIATTSATVSNVSLYAYTDSSYSSPISGQTNGQIGNAALTLVYPSNVNPALATATPTTPVQVPAGSTLYFELRGSVSGVQSGSSVVTTLKGDSAYITSAHLGLSAPFLYVSSTTGAVADSATFIWSGNSTSTSATTDQDWSNGYGLPGFSSSGLIQTRSN